jgi:hypothetical protein
MVPRLTRQLPSAADRACRRTVDRFPKEQSQAYVTDRRGMLVQVAAGREF